MNAIGQTKAQQSLQKPQHQPRPGFIENDRLAELANRMRAYLRAGIPVHLRGPAGCGKTSIAMHVGSSLNRPISMVVGDKNMTTADLVGAKSGYQTTRVVDNFVNSVTKVEENAIQGWQDHRLTVACREGHTFIYDEFNRSPASANNVFLGVLEERVLILPAHNKREEYLKVHPNFSLILTSNPTEYAGTHTVQDALADRMITIELDHQDRETEIDITLARSGVSRAVAERIVDFVRAYRSSGAYDQTPTMRASIMIAKIVEAGALELTMRDPLIGQICADVLHARCGNASDRTLHAVRIRFLTELARHHFDGAPRPILAEETARTATSGELPVGTQTPEITAIGGTA